jgi:hypothetical protein
LISAIGLAIESLMAKRGSADWRQQVLPFFRTLGYSRPDFRPSCWRPSADGSGTLAPVFTIALTNAFISSIKVASSEAPDSEESEEVHFVYQKIEVTWVEGGKTATDDWNAPA